MNKKLLKEFREVAEQLPPFNYTVKEKYPITGKDLLLTGVTNIEGAPINENQVYDVESPAYHRFNHNRRMKRLYANNVRSLGHEGAYKLVKDYITACVNAAKKQEATND